MATTPFKPQGRKLPYREGSIFALPFKNGGFTLGVVARATGKGGVLGYLYDTVYSELPLKSDFLEVTPNKAILKLMMGDLYLLDGRWKVLGEVENFLREEWPVPNFIRRETAAARAWLVKYNDDINHWCEARTPFDTDEYLEDALHGAGAVEIELESAITLGVGRPLPYQEGFVFALPLKRGGYGLGVVVRITKVGEAACVYIFGKKFSFLPDEEDWTNANPKDAILKPRVLDISLKNGKWPILGKLEHWQRDKWPVPTYFVKEEYSKNARVEIYKNDCLAEILHSEEVPLDYDAEGLEKAQIGPYGVPQIEEIVTNLLSPRTIQEFSIKPKRPASKKKQLPYQEGSVFAIPLKDGGYGIGVVARASGNGDMLGYLYNTRYTTLPIKDEWPQFDPNKTLLKLRMGDEHLLSGAWPVLGKVENWNREEWPVPFYIRRNSFLGKAWTETFFEKELSRYGGGERVPYETKDYLKSVFYTPEAAEFELTQAILYGVDRPLPYQEGSVFAVPLKTGGYVLGVVARTTKVGEVAVVYLFGKRFSELSAKDEWSKLDPNKAILRPRILDSSLQNGKWTILGKLENYKEDAWPMPKYIAREKGFPDAWLETYRETCPAERILSKKVPFDFPAEGYEEGSLFGPYRPSQIEALLASRIQ